MVLIEQSAGKVQRGSAFIKALSDGSVGESFNCFILVCSEKILDVLLFKDRIKDDLLNELEELILVSLETGNA